LKRATSTALCSCLGPPRPPLAGPPLSISEPVRAVSRRKRNGRAAYPQPLWSNHRSARPRRTQTLRAARSTARRRDGGKREPYSARRWEMCARHPLAAGPALQNPSDGCPRHTDKRENSTQTAGRHTAAHAGAGRGNETWGIAGPEARFRLCPNRGSTALGGGPRTPRSGFALRVPRGLRRGWARGPARRA